jgi:hypothetical protein
LECRGAAFTRDHNQLGRDLRVAGPEIERVLGGQRVARAKPMPQVSADKAPKWACQKVVSPGWACGVVRASAFDNLDEEATLEQQYAITRG